MNNIEFEWEIAELIGRRREGEYWDFKQQWYLYNTDLLHDIICMANSPGIGTAILLLVLKMKHLKFWVSMQIIDRISKMLLIYFVKNRNGQVVIFRKYMSEQFR